MTLSIDDLVQKFEVAFYGAANGPRDKAQLRKAVAVVVTALRDEICNGYAENSARDLANTFNEILAGRDAKSQGNNYAGELVCEWTDRGDHWVSACKCKFEAFASSKGRFVCPSCNRPIKYNEILAPRGDEAADYIVKDARVITDAGTAYCAKPEAPAAAPDAVCEWKMRDGVTVYLSPCDRAHKRIGIYYDWKDVGRCPSCGKPVRIVEAAR